MSKGERLTTHAVIKHLTAEHGQNEKRIFVYLYQRCIHGLVENGCILGPGVLLLLQHTSEVFLSPKCIMPWHQSINQSNSIHASSSFMLYSFSDPDRSSTPCSYHARQQLMWYSLLRIIVHCMIQML
jgi:hypothetical protein